MGWRWERGAGGQRGRTLQAALGARPTCEGTLVPRQ